MTGAQQVGTEGHARFEHFLSTGEDMLGAFPKAAPHPLSLPSAALPADAPANGCQPASPKSHDGLVRENRLMAPARHRIHFCICQTTVEMEGL